MKVHHLKQELQISEVVAISEYSRAIGTITEAATIWHQLLDTSARFYDNPAIFIPIDEHQLRLAYIKCKDTTIQAKFEANLDRIIIDVRRTPKSLVATCFRTKTTSYAELSNRDEYADHNELVVRFLKPIDGLNVPILSNGKVKGVIGCINTSSGRDSLANVALMEILAHLTGNWFDLFGLSLALAQKEYLQHSKSLQIIHDALNSLQHSMVGVHLFSQENAVQEQQLNEVFQIEETHTKLRDQLNALAELCRETRGLHK